MRIVLTASGSRFGRTLQHALSAAGHVAVPHDGDLRDPATVGRVLAGADALVHLAPLDFDGARADGGR